MQPPGGLHVRMPSDIPFHRSLVHGSIHAKGHDACTGCQSFCNPPPRYHCTVFHTSQPSDPRPDPFAEGGGTDLALPPAARPSPSSAVLQRESASIHDIVAAEPPFELEVSALLRDAALQQRKCNAHGPVGSAAHES